MPMMFQEHVCLSANPACSGINPCDACHELRTHCLVQGLQGMGGVDRDGMMRFLQGYRASFDASMRQFLAQVQQAQAQAAQIAAQRAAAQPTLNAGEADPHLMGVEVPSGAATPARAFIEAHGESLTVEELAQMRQRFTGDDQAIGLIDELLTRKQPPPAEPTILGGKDLMEPMSQNELEALMREGMQNNALTPEDERQRLAKEAADAAAAAKAAEEKLATTQEAPAQEAIPAAGAGLPAPLPDVAKDATPAVSTETATRELNGRSESKPEVEAGGVNVPSSAGE